MGFTENWLLTPLVMFVIDFWGIIFLFFIDICSRWVVNLTFHLVSRIDSSIRVAINITRLRQSLI